MKKLTICLIGLVLIIILTLSASARMTTVVIGGAVPAGGTSAYCTGAATCTATNPGNCDTICEDFEGASNCDTDDNPDLDGNCRNGYIAAIASGDGIDTTTTGASLCAGTTSTNVVQILQNAGSHITYLRKDSSGDMGAGYLQFYMQVTSITAAAGNNFPIFCIRDSGANALITVRFSRAGDDSKYILSLRYLDTSPALKNATGTTSVSLNTWYRLNLSWDASSNLVLKLNGSNEIVASDFSTTDIRQFYIGNRDGANSNAITFQIDNIAVDADGEPGACL